jgi:5-methylcytosine-specific restriction protein A
MATEKPATKEAAIPAAEGKGKPWSDEELRASVEAYLDMQHKVETNEKFTKSSYYKALAEKYGRTVKSFEFRMQNISAVLQSMGRDPLAGLRAKENVGPENRPKLERMIRELSTPVVGPTAAVSPAPVIAPIAAPTNAAPPISTMLPVEQKRATYNVTRVPMSKPAGVAKPKKKPDSETAPQYERDMEVKSWVLWVANGHCECCGTPAPFSTDKGEPYLEIHHVRQLAHGGPDTPENAVAVCPNCHRELHYGMGSVALRERLYEQVERLVRA